MKDEILHFMPRALTAENGAKYALNGYFNEKVEVHNPDFCGCGECDYCKEFPETPETILQNVPIRWTTIKEIYAKAVEHFQEKRAAEAGKKIELLWLSIIDYSESNYNCGMVGNTLEYYTEEEETNAKVSRESSLETLIQRFSEFTGYTPVPERNQYNFIENWKFKKNNGTD